MAVTKLAEKRTTKAGMSLKAFHVLFVIIAGLLCAGFGVWCFNSAQVLTGIISFAGLAALVVFEINFLRRMKGVK